MAEKYVPETFLPMYVSISEAILELPKDQAYELAHALAEYHLAGKEPESGSITSVIFKQLKPSIDKSWEKARLARKNGAKHKPKTTGTKPTNNPVATQTEPTPNPDTTNALPNANPQHTNEKDKETDKEKAKAKETEGWPAGSANPKNEPSHLQLATGAAAMERSMIERAAYNPFTAAQLELMAEEEQSDSEIDPLSDLLEDGDASTVKSSILPCMASKKLNPDSGNFFLFKDLDGKHHQTPLGALRASYHSRTGKSDYHSFERGIKAFCRANCQKTLHEMDDCWDCIDKGLEKWDPDRSSDPMPLIAAILKNDRRAS